MLSLVLKSQVRAFSAKSPWLIRLPVSVQLCVSRDAGIHSIQQSSGAMFMLLRAPSLGIKIPLLIIVLCKWNVGLPT